MTPPVRFAEDASAAPGDWGKFASGQRAARAYVGCVAARTARVWLEETMSAQRFVLAAVGVALVWACGSAPATAPPGVPAVPVVQTVIPAGVQAGSTPEASAQPNVAATPVGMRTAAPAAISGGAGSFGLSPRAMIGSAGAAAPELVSSARAGAAGATSTP